MAWPCRSLSSTARGRHWREKRSLQREPTGRGRILPAAQGGKQPSPPAAGAPLPAGQETRVAGLCPRKRRGAAQEGAPGERLPAAAPPRPAPSSPGAEHSFQQARWVQTAPAIRDFSLRKPGESQVTAIQTQVFSTAGAWAHQQQGMRRASQSPAGLPGRRGIRGKNTHFFFPPKRVFLPPCVPFAINFHCLIASSHDSPSSPGRLPALVLLLHQRCPRLIDPPASADEGEEP